MKFSSTPYLSTDDQFCWIHISEMKTFLYLGANEYEEKIGQNITINLSIKIKYNNTLDKLSNTVDYGAVCEHIIHKIKTLEKVKLLEFLAEQVLNSIGENFKDIYAAKISIEKGYVPLKNFTGKVKIDAEKEFIL
ncbi:FolB domain-containing protein [Silvanigrella paludirubra]|uniref:FolB domain-containing protein n=1 Tax=Silvanigrella paludirubra TaxID=2499159 RepID=A0A6N6VR89_9BACT|nr:dihydroneopterin aldolase [Silvanigrella paludirubra]KAB8037573.1 FolB domain-containing protein [Silvanigrella paludirubra]